MNPQTLERKSVRTTLSGIGMPITIIALMLAKDCVFMILGGLYYRNGWAVTFGFGGILSYVGLVGAWWRICVFYSAMSASNITLVRALLICGVLGSFALAIGAVKIFSGYGFIGFSVFAFLSLCFYAFYRSTPRSI